MAWRIIAAASALALAGASPAASQGDAATGRRIAETWCASCHTIAAGGVARSDSVPSFPAIAARPGSTADGLRAFLAAPHGRMPQIDLSRNEIDDLVAYLREQK